MTVATRRTGKKSLASLLNRALQISVDIYNRDAGASAITPRQSMCCGVLDGHDGISQTELTRLSGIDRSTLADLLARMVRKGLVLRAPAAGDARIKHVWLDAAGRAILAETAAACPWRRRKGSRPDVAGGASELFTSAAHACRCAGGSRSRSKTRRCSRSLGSFSA
ncbi:MAG: MarR family winged helix-turn-helix transcriptional regulator [Asticcacaulis sp.]